MYFSIIFKECRTITPKTNSNVTPKYQMGWKKTSMGCCFCDPHRQHLAFGKRKWPQCPDIICNQPGAVVHCQWIPFPRFNNMTTTMVATLVRQHPVSSCWTAGVLLSDCPRSVQIDALPGGFSQIGGEMMISSTTLITFTASRWTVEVLFGQITCDAKCSVVSIMLDRSNGKITNSVVERSLTGGCFTAGDRRAWSSTSLV